jgi:hypothetical protein
VAGAFRALGLAGCLALSAGAAEERRARLVDAAAPVRIGDVVVLEVDSASEDGELVVEATPDVELVGAPEVAGRIWRVRFQVLASGRVELPRMRFNGVSSAAVAGTWVDVEPLTDATDQPRPSKLVLSPPHDGPVTLVGLATLAVTAMLFRAARWLAGRPVPGELTLLGAALRLLRTSTQASVPLVPVDYAGQLAVGRLALLERSQLAARDIAAFHDELASIAREWAASRAGCRGDGLTTTEFLDAVAAALPEQEWRACAGLLERCDLVKFAGERPDAMSSLEAARQFRRWLT